MGEEAYVFFRSSEEDELVRRISQGEKEGSQEKEFELGRKLFKGLEMKGEGRRSLPLSGLYSEKEDEDTKNSGKDARENDEAKGGKISGECATILSMGETGEEKVGDEYSDDCPQGVKGAMEAEGFPLGVRRS